jgi:hypothetical protein
MTLKTVTGGEINDVFANNFIIFFCDIICNATTYLSQIYDCIYTYAKNNKEKNYLFHPKMSFHFI